jgi:hypothetical protein
MVKFELEKKRFGFRILFDKPMPFFRDGFEIALFKPKHLPWYNNILPYRYKRDRGD